MRKILLLSVFALCAGMTASAQTFEDITPSNFKWNESGKIVFAAKANKGANFADPVIDNVKLLNNGAFDNNGQIAVCGAPPKVEGSYPNIKESTSIVDLKGRIGKVFCISGSNSKINDKLEELYGAGTIAPIPCKYKFGGWFNLNFFSDPNNTPEAAPGTDNTSAPTDNSIRIRIVYNIFGTTQEDQTDLFKVYCSTNANGVLPIGDNSTLLSSKAADFAKDYIEDGIIQGPDQDEKGHYIWEPTKWKQVEFDTYCPSKDNGGTYSPIRIKMEINPGVLVHSTLFIKSIEFLKVNGNTSPIVKKRVETSVTFADITGINTINKNVAASYSINGNAISFGGNAIVLTTTGSTVAHAHAGQTLTLPSGLYIIKSAGQANKVLIR